MIGWVLALVCLGANAEARGEERLTEDVETIVVTHDDRDRTAPDTRARLDRDDLVQRGVSSVPEALAQLPDVAIHENRRGGIVVDIRGARQRQLLVIVDGVPVSEPWRGIFDLGTIPITEVEEIRLRTSPATPLDGLGGSAGVIEIVTRPSSGPLEATAQSLVTSDPAARVSVTGRGQLSDTFSSRVSGGAFLDRNELDFTGSSPDRLNEDRGEGFASARVTLDRGRLRAFADGFASRRSYWIAPDDDATQAPGVFERVEREESLRSMLGADLRLGSLTVTARGYAQRLEQQLSRFRDPNGRTLANRDSIRAERTGATVEGQLVRGGFRFDGRAEVQSERAVLESTVAVDPVGGRATTTQLSAGASWLGNGFEVLGSAGFNRAVAVEAEPWAEAHLELRAEPLGWLELGAVIARKGRLASLRERFDARGDPNAPPELTDYAEVKASSELGPLRVASTAFGRRIDSFIALGAGASPTLNGQNLEVRGLETRVDWRWTPWASFGAGHTWLDADPNDDAGLDPLPFLPRHRVDLWASLEGDALGLWTRARYTTSRLDQGRPLDPYLIAEASGWWRVDERLRVSLRVDNLTNSRYHTRANLLGDGTRITVALEGRLGS